MTLGAAAVPDTGASRLYAGAVTHRRLRPRRHRLKHSCFWMLIDLDEAEQTASRLRLFSLNRFNLLSLHTRDHGDGSQTPLKAQVETHLRAAGVETGGPIRLLCMPRVLGHGFNPISVYFCHRADGGLSAILYQVHNTFGQRHSYLAPIAHGASAARDVRQSADKRFYVSPFMDMDMSYDFRVRLPDEDVSVAIRLSDADGPMLHAALAGRARPLTDGSILRLWLANPLLTLKVVAAIHVHALVIWLKGVKLRPRPEPPAQPVTVSRT